MINKGTGGQRVLQTEETASAEALRWEHNAFQNPKGSQEGGRRWMREGVGAFFLGSRLEPDYSGPCRPQEAMGSRKSVTGEVPFSCRWRTDWSGKEWLQGPGVSVRGDLRQGSSSTMVGRGNTHIYTAGVGEGLEWGVMEEGVAKRSLTATKRHYFQNTEWVQSLWENTMSLVLNMMDLWILVHRKIISICPKELHAPKVQTSGKKGFQKRRTI